MTTTTDTPRAWVGCLGCYNAGDLSGRWLDDPDEIRNYRCSRPVTIYNSHEELWVFDHEHMPLISGECSPSTFADAIEFLDSLDHRPAAWDEAEEPTRCSSCGDVYDEARGDGYCGLCPSCADATEPKEG
jgi:hypothetical protein